MDSDMKGAVPEDLIHILRKMFSQRLASAIEEDSLSSEGQYTDAHIYVLTQDHLPRHIGYMLDVFGRRELNDKAREEAIFKLAKAVNDTIVDEIRRMGLEVAKKGRGRVSAPAHTPVAQTDRAPCC